MALSRSLSSIACFLCAHALTCQRITSNGDVYVEFTRFGSSVWVDVITLAAIILHGKKEQRCGEVEMKNARKFCVAENQ